MVVLESSMVQKTVTSSVLQALLIAGIGFGLLLIAHSVKLSGQDSGAITGSIGPINLFELSKTPLKTGGFSGGMRLINSGFIAYLMIAIAAGLLRAGFRLHRIR